MGQLCISGFLFPAEGSHLWQCLFFSVEMTLLQGLGQINPGNVSKLDESSSLLLISSTCRACCARVPGEVGLLLGQHACCAWQELFTNAPCPPGHVETGKESSGLMCLTWLMDLSQGRQVVRIQLFLTWHYGKLDIFPGILRCICCKAWGWRSCLYPSAWLAESIIWFPVVILNDDGNVVDYYINKTKFFYLKNSIFS